MLSEISGILLPVFAIAAVGYGWCKIGIPFERETVARLAMNIAGPCLIVDSLSNLTLPADVVGRMAIGGVAMLMTTAVLGFGVLKLARLPVRTFVPALAIGNTGNLGLPVCLFAFGQEGLGLAIAVFVATSIGQFTMTPMLQSGQSPWKTLVTTPVIYGAVIGTSLLLTGYELPDWVARTINLLGGLLIPLMLLALGNTLGSLKVARLPFASFWGLVRLGTGLVIAVLIAEILGLEGVPRGVLILQGAMPAAVTNYLFAARYDRAPDDVAGIVLMSTLISVLTLPLVVAYVLSASG